MLWDLMNWIESEFAALRYFALNEESAVGQYGYPLLETRSSAYFVR